MRKGRLTFFERMIVIVVFAIIAAIVIPRLLGAGREARESMLKADLKEMRNAVGRFKAQCGDFPAQLFDIVASTAPKKGASGNKINPLEFKGPYLPNFAGQLPNNLITRGNTESVDWVYNGETGEVYAKSGNAMDGTDYSTW